VNQPVVAPRTPVEARVMRLWQELLEQPPRSVHDNFFELGGDSMRLVEFMVRARVEFGVDLPPDALFQSALTVSDIAADIEDTLRSQAAANTGDQE
jgi:acyl carrier protein